MRSDIAPVKDAAGNIIGIVTILMDITKEKEIDKMKTEFISVVSHELRTPLTTMKEFISIISDEIAGKLTKSQREYIGIIKGNIDRLVRLINNLLDISKIESGRVFLRKTLINLIDLINGVISTFKPEIDAKHIELKASFWAPLPDIYIDSDKITQVFINLIGNAIKFTPENGKIMVEIVNKKKEIECSVTDTGIGIAPENLNKLFGRFQQFNRVAGPGAKGTGLGLAITKELIEMHNGRIWAESKLDKESKFIFTLPKLSSEDIITEYVNNGIKEAMDKGANFSIVVISLGNFQESLKKLGRKEIQQILLDIEEEVRKTLRRASDIVIRKKEEVVILLPDVKKEDAFVVKDHLKDGLGEYIRKKKDLRNIVQINLGTATFPDEADSQKGLINKAKNEFELIYTDLERRKSKRKKIRIKIRISDAKNKAAQLDYAILRDLNKEGLGLYTKAQLRPGGKLFIFAPVSFQKEPSGPAQGKPFKIKGEVIWSRKIDGNKEFPYRTGIRLRRQKCQRKY